MPFEPGGSFPAKIVSVQRGRATELAGKKKNLARGSKFFASTPTRLGMAKTVEHARSITVREMTT